MTPRARNILAASLVILGSVIYVRSAMTWHACGHRCGILGSPIDLAAWGGETLGLLLFLGGIAWLWKSVRRRE